MMERSAPLSDDLSRPGNGRAAFEFLDDLLHSEIDARLIALGIRYGWFGPQQAEPRAFEQLSPNARRLAATRLAALGLWTAERPGVAGPRLPAFAALRELIEARLWFLLEIAPDFSSFFELFLGVGGPLVQRAKLFRLFDYSAALQDDVDAQHRTSRWLRYTTLLTEFEGPDIAPRLGIEGVARLVDAGGNSGAFGLALLQHYPALSVEVFDLPAVCALGRKYVEGKPESRRMMFTAGDLRASRIPAADAVCFKSVLHDWPPDMALMFITKAADSMPSGGRLFIVEREAPDFPPGPSQEKPGFSQLANFAFLPFYRAAEAYVLLLEEAGLRTRRVERFALDGPFFLIEAEKT